jgi:parvulin-like peptidyl-prolyl isomerase
MKRLTVLILAGLLAGPLLSAAPAQIPPDDEVHELHSLPLTTLIYVDDTVLTVGSLGDYLFNSGVHPSGVRDRDLDTLNASMQAFIDEVIIFRDLDSAALMSDPTARRRVRWRMAHRAGPLAYTHLVAPRVSVSRQEIEQFYQDSLKTIFTAPSRREVRHLLISPRDSITSDGRRFRGRGQIEAARVRADSLKRAVLAGASFDSLAGAFSDDSGSRAQNGYLGWIYPGNTVFDFDSAAFAASVGEIRGPIKTLYGYHLIKVEQIRPESTVVLSDSVIMLIQRQLEFSKGRALGTVWADSLVAATRWRFNDSALQLVPHLDSNVWLVTLNDRDSLWWADWKGAWELYQRTQKIEGEGTLEDKHASLKAAAFPYLYLQVAEDQGFADDPSIVAENRQFLQSEALRLEKERLNKLQEPPADLVDPTQGLELQPEPEKPLHLQRLCAADTATIWTAYRSLWAGEDIQSVARRYHNDLREVRSGRWDLGWVGPKDLPAELWGKAWILEPGRFTRPFEYDSAYYILRLVDRFHQLLPQERRNKEIDAVRAQYRQSGLDAWRREIRAGHHIRLDRSAWNRVQQLWRR